MFLNRKLLYGILSYFTLLLLPYLSFATIIDNTESTTTTAMSVHLYGGSYEVNAQDGETEKNFDKDLYVDYDAVINVVGNGESDSATISAEYTFLGFINESNGTLNVSDGGSYTSSEDIVLGSNTSTGEMNITSGGNVGIDDDLNLRFGEINVSDGGSVRTGDHLYLATNSDGSGTINVDGAYSSVETGGWLVAGAPGSDATINITNGGMLQVGDDDSGAYLQLTGGGSSTIEVNVTGRSVQVQTIWDDYAALLEGSEEEFIAFENDLYDHLTSEEWELYGEYQGKFWGYVFTLSSEEYEALQSNGELGSAFWATLTEEEQQEFLSNPNFATETELSRSKLIVDDTISFENNDAETTTTLTVSDYGLVEADRILVDGEGQSNIDVSDMGEVNAEYIMLGTRSSDLYNEETDSATLSVRDTGVVNSDILVYLAGTLTGDGTINGDVYVYGGEVAPGNSPGTLNINGDFYMDDGTLEIEIDTSGYDILNVSGNIYFGENALISIFLNDLTIDSIDFLSFFTGYTSLDFSADFDFLQNISFWGLPDDFSIDLIFSGTTYTYTNSSAYINDDSGNGNLSAVPEPTTMILFGFGLIGLVGISRRKS